MKPRPAPGSLPYTLYLRQPVRAVTIPCSMCVPAVDTLEFLERVILLGGAIPRLMLASAINATNQVTIRTGGSYVSLFLILATLPYPDGPVILYRALRLTIPQHSLFNGDIGRFRRDKLDHQGSGLPLGGEEP